LELPGHIILQKSDPTHSRDLALALVFCKFPESLFLSLLPRGVAMVKIIRKALIFGVLCFCLVNSPLLHSQARAQIMQKTGEVSELRQMTRRAGAIFAGRVLSVQYLRPRFTDEVPTMRVTFRVERGIRGARTGSTFVLREWAALWNGGERYQVGERVLLFLYPRSRVGLTSPVGGERGRFRVDTKGQVIVNAERAELFERSSLRERSPNRLRTRIHLGDVSRMIRRFQAEEVEP
jgi:hypothetical protein